MHSGIILVCLFVGVYILSYLMVKRSKQYIFYALISVIICTSVIVLVINGINDEKLFVGVEL